MDIQRVGPAELSVVFTLLIENGWDRRITDLDKFGALINASPIADVAIIDGEVVGFVRGITDGFSNGYLSMLVVASSHRGRGIGTALVRHAMGINPRVTWVLRAGRQGATEFFTKLGFEVSSIAMERRRT
jgi:ribosomal protein S18 acetylase RimI-like enzyme